MLPHLKLPDVPFHSGAAVGPRGRLFGRVCRVRLTVHRQGRLSPSERERLAQAPLAPPIPARRHVTVQPARGHGALSRSWALESEPCDRFAVHVATWRLGALLRSLYCSSTATTRCVRNYLRRSRTCLNAGGAPPPRSGNAHRYGKATV